MTSRHEGVKCDACDVTGFRLRRYKCLRCIDFDLCGKCFDNSEVTDQHRQNHPMQCIILDSDRKLFFPNAKPSEISRSYTCPVCGATGFKVADLTTHVEAKHPNAHCAVLCPLCIYPPPDNPVPAGCSPNRTYKEFLSHLLGAHRLKKSSAAASSQVQESDNINASIEASLTRDEDYYYKPVDDAMPPVLCGYDDLSPDEKVIDSLISRSAILPRGSLNLRLQLEKLNSTTVPNASVPTISQSPKSAKMSELVHVSCRKEAGDNGSLSQQSGNASNNNNNEDDDVDDEDSDTDVGDVIPEATGENRNDSGCDQDDSILVNFVDRASEKGEVDKDGESCDQNWITFVQELMWDSLHLERLSLTPGATE
ncbi:hypothetical protein Aperf_G00000060880 [Anoplocephala perfoliata]